MIIYDWPSILVANAETFRIDARTRSGGETIQGREQAVSSGLGRWIARLTVPLHTPAKIRAARALLAKLDGRANAVRVGPCDCRNGNQIIPLIGGIPYSDKTSHTDGSRFQQGGTPPVVAADAAAGAYQVQVDVGATMVPVLDGTFVGLGGYLYVITGATPLPGEEALLDIRPRLRTPLDADDPVEWCHARLPMRLMTDDSGAFELQLARTGNATFDLVEVF
ncbi:MULTISPECIES: hypothetical protein [Inquilinus]|uniref:Uncharacterized protein n=1 Tax=Inquilinus ginsengisoli TaxID=363840 RepID=A0ABU1JMZ8_9PROT|nr:hypothetical protein [Inquilinus ginsengisoli]MDR6289990.1 hypothetical protein [Inquilinus ginsengisoli]